VVERLREMKGDVAIMTLGTDREMECLFDIGADDYVIRPPNRVNGVDYYLWKGSSRRDLKVIELGICAEVLTGGRMRTLGTANPNGPFRRGYCQPGELG
jgi:hypothetical protein